MEKKLNVGLVGYKFMGKAHSGAFTQLPIYFGENYNVNKKVICGRNKSSLAKAAAHYGWDSYVTDYKEMFKMDEIDIVDVTAPSNFHKDIILEAIDAGKHVFCEKPLALNLADAREMLKVAQDAGVKHQIGFNYRFAPAIQLAKKLIDDGKIGRIFHFRAYYLQDWIVDPNFPMVWRLNKDVCGSGALGDIGAHIIDLAHFLVGDIKLVTGMNKTFIKERPIAGSMDELSAVAKKDAPKGIVDVDDATIFCTEFENGALGTFTATRFASGNKNGMGFEINGSKGSIKFFFENMNELNFCDFTEDSITQGFTRIQATDSMHGHAGSFWPVGHVIGYADTFTIEMYEFMKAIKENQKALPGFEAGVKAAQVMDAVELSIKNRAWVNVNEL